MRLRKSKNSNGALIRKKNKHVIFNLEMKTYEICCRIKALAEWNLKSQRQCRYITANII